MKTSFETIMKLRFRSKIIDVLYYIYKITLMTLLINRLTFNSRSFCKDLINLEETYAVLHLAHHWKNILFALGGTFSAPSFGKAYQIHFQSSLISSFLFFRD